ncbi:MAG: formylglycine-generating enzyme family protein [Betaproteobacteria bacterium]|nr:formylglycine-generating enzyme family protein [Betaproteobacteria bacterium]
MRITGALLLVLLSEIVYAQGAGTAKRDCADCPEMVVIPAGRFLMGVAPGEEDREQLADAFRGRSEPQRAVSVRRFALSKFEVTRGEYRVFAEATKRAGDGCFAWNGADFEKDPNKDWRNTGYAQDDTHPVVCVSWDDANAYAAWLAARTGKKYRLPSEAEWEYAARAGSNTSRFWGDDERRACEFANGADASARARTPHGASWGGVACDDGHAFTAPVGRFRANAFGLNDMLGNAGEWTQDCWNANYQGAPADGAAWLAGECHMRAVRGGAWDDGPAGVRAAYRVGSPTVIRLYSRGFRVARDE